MVRSAPLPYVTPGFLDEVRRQYFGKDPAVTCARMAASLEKMLSDLDDLEAQERNPRLKQLYGQMIDDTHRAIQDSRRIAAELRGR